MSRTAAAQGQSLNNRLDPDGVEGERAGGDRCPGRFDLREHGRVPRDCDVDQPLEEVLLRRLRGAPRQLDLLVRGEELASADRFEPALEIAIRRRRRP